MVVCVIELDLNYVIILQHDSYILHLIIISYCAGTDLAANGVVFPPCNGVV